MGVENCQNGSFALQIESKTFNLLFLDYIVILFYYDLSNIRSEFVKTISSTKTC